MRHLRIFVLCSGSWVRTVSDHVPRPRASPPRRRRRTWTIQTATRSASVATASQWSTISSTETLSPSDAESTSIARLPEGTTTLVPDTSRTAQLESARANWRRGLAVKRANNVEITTRIGLPSLLLSDELRARFRVEGGCKFLFVVTLHMRRGARSTSAFECVRPVVIWSFALSRRRSRHHDQLNQRFCAAPFASPSWTISASPQKRA